MVADAIGLVAARPLECGGSPPLFIASGIEKDAAFAESPLSAIRFFSESLVVVGGGSAEASASDD